MQMEPGELIKVMIGSTGILGILAGVLFVVFRTGKIVQRFETLDGTMREIVKSISDGNAKLSQSISDVDTKLSKSISDLDKRMAEGFKSADEQFRKIDHRLDVIDGRLNNVDYRLGVIDKRLDGFDSRFQRIEDNNKARFEGRLEGLLEERMFHLIDNSKKEVIVTHAEN